MHMRQNVNPMLSRGEDKLLIVRLLAFIRINDFVIFWTKCMECIQIYELRKLAESKSCWLKFFSLEQPAFCSVAANRLFLLCVCRCVHVCVCVCVCMSACVRACG